MGFFDDLKKEFKKAAIEGIRGEELSDDEDLDNLSLGSEFAKEVIRQAKDETESEDDDTDTSPVSVSTVSVKSNHAEKPKEPGPIAGGGGTSQPLADAFVSRGGFRYIFWGRKDILDAFYNEYIDLLQEEAETFDLTSKPYNFVGLALWGNYKECEIELMKVLPFTPTASNEDITVASWELLTVDNIGEEEGDLFNWASFYGALIEKILGFILKSVKESNGRIFMGSTLVRYQLCGSLKQLSALVDNELLGIPQNEVQRFKISSEILHNTLDTRDDGSIEIEVSAQVPAWYELGQIMKPDSEKRVENKCRLLKLEIKRSKERKGLYQLDIELTESQNAIRNGQSEKITKPFEAIIAKWKQLLESKPNS